MEIKFNYGRKDASCKFCCRVKNPHPDFDEPLVTTNLKYDGKQEIEVCINCFHEIKILAEETNESFKNVVKEKLNLSRLLNKSLDS